MAGRRRGSPSVDGNTIARELCDGPRFAKYNEWARHGCMKLIAEHLGPLLEPMDGQHQVGEQSVLLEHKRKVVPSLCRSVVVVILMLFMSMMLLLSCLCLCSHWCWPQPHAPCVVFASLLVRVPRCVGSGVVQACVQVQACTDTSKYLWNEPSSRTRCDACKAIVRDIEMEIDLLEKPGRADVGKIVEGICELIPLRHSKPALLEEVCQDMLDEAQVCFAIICVLFSNVPVAPQLPRRRARLTVGCGCCCVMLQGDKLADSEGTIVGLIMLRRRIINAGLAPSDVLEDRVCGELTSMCGGKGSDL